MGRTLDETMERASEALGRMDYLACEALCVEALADAREQQRWAYYARILLPLQEARRQRRLIAADGLIRLGTASLSGSPADWLDQLGEGCIVVTHPHSAEQARALDEAAKRARRYIEVLFADNGIDDDPWRLCSWRGPGVEVKRPAPAVGWLDRWLDPAEEPVAPGTDESHTPGDWVLDASEALGDAAIEKVEARSDAIPGGAKRVELLEQMLPLVPDHEILHQKLGDAARAIR